MTNAASSVAASPGKRTWEACAGLHESQAPLARLDNKVVFGNDYPLPIRYDAERKLLQYRGFMSHATYVKLAALCDDRDYQTALERLFVATSPSVEAPVRQVPWKGIAAAVVAVAVMVCGWYAREVRLRRAPEPAPDRVVTRKVELPGDIAAKVPKSTTERSEVEGRHPVER
jgi:hypothetical protein